MGAAVNNNTVTCYCRKKKINIPSLRDCLLQTDDFLKLLILTVFHSNSLPNTQGGELKYAPLIIKGLLKKASITKLRVLLA